MVSFCQRPGIKAQHWPRSPGVTTETIPFFPHQGFPSGPSCLRLPLPKWKRKIIWFILEHFWKRKIGGGRGDYFFYLGKTAKRSKKASQEHLRKDLECRRKGRNALWDPALHIHE